MSSEPDAESDNPELPSLVDTIERQAEMSNIEELDLTHTKLLSEYAYAFTDSELEEAINIWRYWEMENAANLGEHILSERE